MDNTFYRQVGGQIKRARERAGLSQEDLADALNKDSAASISHYETGQRKVSLVDLQTIANVTELPLDFFLGKQGHEEDFHRLRFRAQRVYPDARDEVVQFLAFSEKDLDTQTVPTMPTKTTLGAEQAANEVHKELGLTGPPFDPFRIADKLGIAVLNWEFPNAISGVIVDTNNKVSIGVNSSHPLVRQRFTVAHEIGHYFLSQSEDVHVDFSESYYVLEDPSQETAANQFAASLLMPANLVRTDFQQYGESGLVRLAQKYLVSEQAMWFRLKNLGLVR